MVRLISTIIGLFGATFLFWAGIAFEHRPAGWPNLTVPLGPFHWTIRLPDSPSAQLAVLEAAERAAAARVRSQEAQSATISSTAGQREQGAQVTIRTVYRTIHDEIPTYIDRTAVAACTVPTGYIRLFNAGARGIDPGQVPDPSGRSDESASGVDLDTVASFTLANDAIALANAEQLSALQDWIRSQAAAWGQP